MEYKRASAYIATVDRNKKKESDKKKRVKVKIATVQAKRKAKKMIEKAEKAGARKGKGKVPASVREASARLRATTTGKKAVILNRKPVFQGGTSRVYKAEPARVLRRPTQDDYAEIDRIGLDFPELHDEYKKTMALLHGGDVGDSL